MTDKERLYETLGELLYAVAMADGIIQPQEMVVLENVLLNHKWASTIKWSFNYEDKQHTTAEEAYDKVIAFCHMHGPAAEYQEFIDVMNQIANADQRRTESEDEVINSFTKDLIARFQHDIDTNNWHPENTTR